MIGIKDFPVVWHIGGEDVRLRIPLLLALKERGFKVGAVGSEGGTEFSDYGIPYWRYRLNRWISPFEDLRSKRELHSLFRQYHPDIVHAFDTKPGFLVPGIAKKAEIRGRVRTITGMGYVFSADSGLATLLKPVYRYLQRQASRASSMTIFQNPDDLDYFKKNNLMPEDNFSLVPGSGIDYEHFQSIRPKPASVSKLREELGIEKKLMVTMVARLVVHKGVREFLEASTLVQGKKDDVAFVLVGPASSEGKQAVSLSEVEAKAEQVIYLGPRDDVPALLAASDIFVLPSFYREGVPRVLLEAGAMGLPLITTDMPGCREVVRQGWNGVLVPPRNATALADAVLCLANKSEDDRKKMGCRSSERIQEHFSLDKVAEAYADIYWKILQNT